MTNGFGKGYFGMHVISDTERRILFSIWGSSSSDAPEDEKVVLNRKGIDVIANNFDGDVTGGQSYLKYNWKAGKTYKFLLHGKPDQTGKTNYTAWFNSPDQNQWILIASWKKPKTDTYLKNLYSFVENFYPDAGYHGRKAEYKNGWIRTKTGNWLPLSEAKFTVDASYRNKQRIDAIGGVTGNSFFLQNGGFFNDIVTPNIKLYIPESKNAPDIDFTKLP